jgi:hypothetical protein
MPAYTLGEIMSQATFRAGRRADLTASQVSFWVNEAGLELAEAYPRALSETTVELSLTSGSNGTSLPSDFDTPVLLSWMSGGSGTTMKMTTPGVIDSMGTATGIPTHFCFYGSGIEYRPIPSSGLTALLRYRTQWVDMSNTTSVPSFSTPWRRALIDKTEEKIYHAIGDGVSEAQARERYLSYVHSLPSDQARRMDGDHNINAHVVGYD